MAISLFDTAVSPADNGSNDSTTVTITPPGSMTSSQWVLLIVGSRDSAGANDTTYSVSTTGGQSWTELTPVSQGIGGHTVFYCTFNGTWDTDPIVTCTDPETTDSCQALMAVFDGVDTSDPFNVSDTAAGYSTPSGPPYDVTISGITTTVDGAWVIAIWMSGDDNTWLLGTGGWTNIGGTQFRNNGSADTSLSAAYMQVDSDGSGDVDNEQTSRGPDPGTTRIFALKPSVAGGRPRRNGITLMGVT